MLVRCGISHRLNPNERSEPALARHANKRYDYYRASTSGQGSNCRAGQQSPAAAEALVLSGLTFAASALHVPTLACSKGAADPLNGARVNAEPSSDLAHAGPSRLVQGLSSHDV